MIGVYTQASRGTTLGAVRVTIKNLSILKAYIIPFFKNLGLVSKKGKDLLDFETICRVLYIGGHKDDQIKSLILKLSYTMNNFRLSNSKKVGESLSSHEMALLNNALPHFEHLADGRVVHIETGRVVDQNNIVLITQKDGVVDKVLTQEETAKVLNISRSTLGNHFKKSNTGEVEVKGCLVKRVRVFHPYSGN